MTVDRSTMQRRYPGLIDYTDETQTRLLLASIEDAEQDVDEGIWGDLYDRGVATLAAHRTAQRRDVAEGDEGAAFPVQQSSADGISGTYAVPADLAPDLAHYYTTAYGVEHMELFRRVSSGPRLA